MTGSLMGKISSLLNISNLRKFKKRLDPRLYNGAIFIGLDAPVVKSHGGTDHIGFSNSINVCNKIIKGNLIDKINRRFSKLSDDKNEKRIWSIEIFESIVAFCVNKKHSSLVSEPTDNGGKNDNSIDYRYEDNQAIKDLEYINKFLKYIPGFKFIIKQLKFFLVKVISKSKIFFR